MSNDYYNKTGNPQTNSAGSSSLIRAEFTSIETMAGKLAPLTANGDKVIVVNSAGTAQDVVARDALVAGVTHAGASKATPVDADELPLSDSATSFSFKKLTWANLKATLVSYFQSVGLNSTSIGATTPSTGAFTTLSASGVLRQDDGVNGRVELSSGVTYNTLISATTGAGAYKQLRIVAGAGSSVDLSSTGLSVTGALSASGGQTFGVPGVSGTYSTVYWPNTSGLSAFWSQNDGVSYTVGTGGTPGTGTVTSVSASGLAVTGAGSYTGNITTGDGTGSSNVTLNSSSGGTNQINWQKAGAQRYAMGRNVGTGGADDLSIYDYTLGTTIAQFTGGNLGLGVTPSAWQTGTAFQGSGGSIWFRGASNGVSINQNMVFSGGTYNYIGSDYASRYSQASGAHAWYTAPSGTAGDAITFTQAMTLDSSGNLLVGTTSANANLAKGIQVASTNWGSAVAVTASAGAGTCAAWGRSTDGNVAQFYHDTSFTSVVGSISVTASATAYNTTSDQRLKDNIADAEYASALIDSLQVRQFDWKSDGSHQRYGFVAQELVTVAPEAVHQPTNPDDMMAVDYSKLVPMLVKEIQSLRTRIAALEAA